MPKKNALYLVNSFCDGGSLDNIVEFMQPHKSLPKYLTPKLLYKWSYEVCLGMAFIHRKGISLYVFFFFQWMIALIKGGSCDLK